MLTEQETAMVSPYVTSTTAQVYALKNLPEIVKAAVFGRYSRTHLTAREMLAREFLPNLTLPEPTDIDTSGNYSEDFFRRVLLEYGDDSVAELAGAHIAVEGVSSLLADRLTDARVGVSPLEKSGRYVTFGRQGEEEYVIPPSIVYSRYQAAYHEHMRHLFDFYSRAQGYAQRYVAAHYSRAEDVTVNAYNRAVKAQAADLVKNILPASRKTSLGLFGNARAFELMMNKLLSRPPFGESMAVVDQMREAISDVIPVLVSRVSQKPWLHTSNIPQGPPTELPQRTTGNVAVRLVTPAYGTLLLSDICRALLFSRHGTAHEWYDLGLDSIDACVRVIESVMKPRQSRRDKPPRAYEQVSLTFEMFTTYAVWRDLHRHRLVSSARTNLGESGRYAPFPEIGWPEGEKEYKELMSKSIALWSRFSEADGEYCIPRAFKVRWFMTANLRELYHIIELRSQKQGHPEYRAVAQALYEEIRALHPALVMNMFVDLSDPYGGPLTRIAAEQRNEVKRQQH